RELHPDRGPPEGHHHLRRREYFLHRGGARHRRPPRRAGVCRGVGARPPMGRSGCRLRGGEARPHPGATGALRLPPAAHRQIQNAPPLPDRRNRTAQDRHRQDRQARIARDVLERQREAHPGLKQRLRLRYVLGKFNILVNWPGLHNLVQRMPPVVARPAPYAAVYNFTWLSASGTACLIAAILGAMVTGLSLARFGRVLRHTAKQLALAELTLAAVLGLAFLMNYSGATATLGLAFAATGAMFPFFSAMLGWLGVFLTGSDTSANALFGTLQVVTAQKLGQNPVLMAAANSAGGVMGKMISLPSIAVAAAATSMKREDEARLFRFTLKHSIFLASMIGLMVMFYAYVMPGWAP